MKNELGIEICCENCIRRRTEYCDVVRCLLGSKYGLFKNDFKPLEDRIKELQFDSEYYLDVICETCLKLDFEPRGINREIARKIFNAIDKIKAERDKYKALAKDIATMNDEVFGPAARALLESEVGK
nr:MAG TPA: hypothetical protein [Caudoviricetes sp.]